MLRKVSHVIFVYGQCAIQKPFAIIGSELDEHFGWPVQEPIEEVTSYFQKCFFEILSGAGKPSALAHQLLKPGTTFQRARRQ